MIKLLITVAVVLYAGSAYADIVCTTVGNVTTCTEVKGWACSLGDKSAC